MSIVVVGNVDPVKISKVIENGVKKNEPFEEKIKKVYPTEPDEVAKQYAEQSLSVAMPLFMTGFKDTNNGFGGDELLKKSIETNIILKMLFGRSSKFYKSLYEKGLINNRFSLEYTMQPDYAYSSIDGESSDPKAVYEAVINEVEETRKNGLSKEDFERIKKWYDGYYLNHQHVYNPKAVVSLFTLGVFQSYWAQTSSYESIHSLIQMNFDGLKEAVLEMLSGNEVKMQTTSFQNDMVSFKNMDDVLTALVHLGYLGYNQTYKTVFIPNEEIRQEFVNSVSEDKWNDLIQFERESDTILEATCQMKTEVVAKQMEKIHNTYASNIAYHYENSLSSVLTIAYLSTLKYYFKPIRELPTGRGFADFVYIPKPEYKDDYPALLVELKWNYNVQSALDQIKEKVYPQSIQEYTNNLLLVGINYDPKTKEHRCKIEKF